MHGDDFYEDFKDALASCGLLWGRKGEATITRTRTGIVVSHNNTHVLIPVPAMDGNVLDGDE